MSTQNPRCSAPIRHSTFTSRDFLFCCKMLKWCHRHSPDLFSLLLFFYFCHLTCVNIINVYYQNYWVLRGYTRSSHNFWCRGPEHQSVGLFTALNTSVGIHMLGNGVQFRACSICRNWNGFWFQFQWNRVKVVQWNYFRVSGETVIDLRFTGFSSKTAKVWKNNNNNNDRLTAFDPGQMKSLKE